MWVFTFMIYYKFLSLDSIRYFCEIDYIFKIEQWLPVVGYEDIYEVSDLGRLKSLDRTILTSNQGGECFKFYKGRIIKGNISNKGYIVSTLSKLGVQKKVQIHQLIAVSFMGHTPCGLNLVVDHIDHNILNNKLNNLQIITNRENVSKDRFRSNYTSKCVGVNWYKKRNMWRAQIFINKKNVYLGLFETEKKANKAYQKALLNSI